MRNNRWGESTQRGLTLFGVLTILAVAAVLGSFVVTGVIDYIHKERMDRCLTEISAIQAVVWPLWAEGSPPDPDRLWADYWAGQKPGPYHYVPNTEVETSGHGYEYLGCDQTRTTGRPCMNFKFVVVCTHDHGNRARYVYIQNNNPPILATEGSDPRYDEFVDKDDRSDLAGRGSL